ncbi:oxygen-independent coproporphyrinogen-3 oxidase [Pseudoglutamicibacter albus]|uniref:Heme chaperone HemW n=1 Tax=Pseudoglutamicibacter albus TaxID=98671 RepID=A0ABU1YYR6_9MICC|nr:radical SAM family heme chaperone HemW [Pseudoglutamicibacter albus]MDR7293502.1 oxygen-independent coproporphyrinogen-3 oxidase [Pseudoglutamicibacter albus]
MAQLPEGDPAPADGALTRESVADAHERSLSFYVHIPFCAVRCGYCDFNTYTATELGHGASQDTYALAAAREVDFSSEVLRRAGAVPRELSTVFFGGGTPTLLPAGDLVMILERARSLYGVAPDAEVTTEANPDSVTPESLAELRAGGFTRVSFGMQSAVPHVLSTLDRTHSPERVSQAVQWARDAGLDVSVDLIYGTPGESIADWQASLDAALALEPDHVSAYSLIVEPGTKLAAQMRRGEVPMVDEDDHAEKYELADVVLADAGFSWYEVSNWARSEKHQARHNVAYWRNQDWWGIGPGAHSHIGGIRWWNVKHPSAYQQRIDAGVSPALAREVPSADARHLENIMLSIRLASGLPVSMLSLSERGRLPGFVARGLGHIVDGAGNEKPTPEDGDRFTLTLKGRLLADGLVLELIEN